jgi:ABC-type lipoprotein export system ATPase subunit
MIKTQKLTKIFQTDEIETSALNEVNFNVQKGEFVAIMGPSGCGKSTLLNIVGLLDNPTKGVTSSTVLMFQKCARVSGQPYAKEILDLCSRVLT